ncbi:class A beta-lactamase [Streptomyces sp. DSM 44917]|uniref:Beta-lactamase n=1 Tax=Streptomyces boetiae TaxID=3075541 RepID=A0ABU2L2Y0_9ACTN|nr:class A beta-lactamase [Streptomyces sp. DSM 44917]MDT0305914.1 class A beta-lactamase [Streptomyces sp. DSM 44917]
MTPPTPPKRRAPGAASRRAPRGAFLAACLLALAAALPACTSEEEPDGREASPSATDSAGNAPLAVPAEETAAGLRELEGSFDARLGVYALDTGTGREVAHRADERFAYASTFKALLVGALLRERGEDGLEEVITYGSGDLIANSPVTENFTETGMSLRELCAATLWYSDNAAANLLLEELGGPDALEAVLRELGDDTTGMDRVEPDLSEGAPGDERDTSTPRALAADLRAFLLGDALEERERGLLRRWMETNTTGETLIAAGLPEGWTVADKSGTAGYGGRNDIAVLWPEDGGDPVVLAVLSTRERENAERDDALIAEAAGVALRGLGRA